MEYLIILIFIGLGVLLWRAWRNPKIGTTGKQDINLTALHLQMLEENISFYRALTTPEKEVFHREVEEFLSKVKIHGVDTEVSELDKILIASSAVIPLFAFPDWFYPNIVVVELYKDTFNFDFETNGANRVILGMVGGGVMNGRLPFLKRRFG
jgi:MtfA peptidase